MAQGSASRSHRENVHQLLVLLDALRRRGRPQRPELLKVWAFSEEQFLALDSSRVEGFCRMALDALQVIIDSEPAVLPPHLADLRLQGRVDPPR